MTLRLVYSAVKGEFSDAIQKMRQPIAIAATGAIRDAAAFIKTQGRANIAGAGFSRKWQNALRVDVFPAKGTSAHPALKAKHKIPYAAVFETGAQIRGAPLLWLPVGNAPARIGGKRMTPRNYTQAIGPLHLIKVSGKFPMLAGYISGKPGGKITAAKLRRGHKGEGKQVTSVPLFVGIPTVKIRRHFALRAIFQQAKNDLGSGYLRHLAEANK